MLLTSEDLLRMRKNAKVTQAALGSAVGVSRRTIANWETGAGQPTFNEFIKLCGACSLNVLFLVRLILSRKNDIQPLDLEQEEQG